ncbi:MAG: cyclase family protein [Pseudomonadota bacterium]
MFAGALTLSLASLSAVAEDSLWGAYDALFKHAKYIDLSHTITPTMPVWPGFGDPTFAPAKAAEDLGQFGQKGEPFTYDKQGFVATAYLLPTDQLGTQLDPPAHWAPEYPSIDELPATYTLRPLVVIPMQDKVAQDFGYALQVSDIEEFEKEHGRIPAGAVVFVRSDWSKGWPDKDFVAKSPFPGVGLAALQFLHEERNILFHGHEPLDTDATPNLEGEHWLMHNGYAQAEGVTNLDMVAPTGCLVAIGFPKFKGGVGGYARYVGICPSDWEFGVTISDADAPLPKQSAPLHWDESAGTRIR